MVALAPRHRRRRSPAGQIKGTEIDAEELAARYEAHSAKLDDALALVDALTKENKLLREQLQLLKQARFGRSSERMEAGQLDLFRTGEAPSLPEPAAAVPAPHAKKKGHGRSSLPAQLPRNVIVLDVPEGPFSPS